MIFVQRYDARRKRKIKGKLRVLKGCVTGSPGEVEKGKMQQKKGNMKKELVD
jgi:hypothetical protein